MKFILLSILLTICVLFLVYNQEHYGRIHGKWCEKCNKKTFGQCMDCFNCGFCLKGNNKGYCTEGTVFGPNNKYEKCQRWIHNDDYSRSINLTGKCSD